jgi:hypothetical protein
VAEISGATLRPRRPSLARRLWLLGQVGSFVTSAEIVAYTPQQSFSKARADDVLSLSGGQFDLTAPWRASRPNGNVPNLSAWLDCTAEIRFQISGPVPSA